jgi:hypothetical protein
MTKIRQGVGDEGSVPDYLSNLRGIIEKETMHAIRNRYREIYNCSEAESEVAEALWDFDARENGGYIGHVVFFDHFQDDLKYIIYGVWVPQMAARRGDYSVDTLTPQFVREQLWDDSGAE